MLTAIEVRSGQGIYPMPLDDVTDGVIIKSIDGLDPVKAIIVSSSFAGMNGTRYHTSRREERYIKFKFGLEPDYVTETVEEVRKRLYAYFMPKTPVSFTFTNSDGLDVDISGRVETCETPLFAKEPEMDVSITCFDSDFVDPVKPVVEGFTVSDTTNFAVDYIGSVETGVDLLLEIDRTVTEFTVYCTPPDGILRKMDFAAPLVAGDLLEIHTTPGQKSATLTRGSAVSSILYGLSPQSQWIEFQRGINNIRVYAEGAGIPLTITYSNRYGGL